MNEDIRSIIVDIIRHAKEIREMDAREICNLSDELALIRIRSQLERLSAGILARRES